MIDIMHPEPAPTWTPETQAVFDRFVARGGTDATWRAANPDCPPPPAAQPPKPAERDVWQEIKQNMAAAADAMARASFAWKQRRAQRGRQTR